MNGSAMRSTVAVLVAFTFGVGEIASTAQAAAAAQAAPAPAQAPAVPAPAVTQASWSADALEELLAPVALYPDQLLGQILAASINSQEVMDGGNWLVQNQNLKGNDLDAAAQKAGFGPAMRALLQYPTVVDMMCQQMDWTRQLGSAFSSDQKSVLDAVQRLRKEAADVGNLKSTPQQTVVPKTEGGNVYIEVKPADPQIVYVPQYDPQAVYTTPPPQAAPATTTTTEKEKDGVSKETAVAAGLIAFVAGIAVGSAINNNDYYYPHWGAGVYYGGRPFYPPAYAYRPVYGPAFRPAYGYHPPANYRHSYNNVNVRGNNNVVINNNNYYNRFNNNQNLRTGSARSPLANSPQRTGQPRAGQTAGNSGNWKGQSTYAGAGNTNAGNSARQTTAARPTANTRETQAANRAPAQTTTAAARADRGYDSAARPANSQTNAARPASSQTKTAATRPTSQPAAAKHDSAFSSGQSKGSGNFQRSASARGNASVGSRQTSAGRVKG